MKIDIQENLIKEIKSKLTSDDSFGRSLSEVLSLSQDAIYRRYRGETPFTIYEIQKICSHYNISFDSLLEMQQNRVAFQYNSLSEYDFSLDRYLEGILVGMREIKSFTNPSMIITIKDTPLFQLLNFPHLFRFKLYFWAKSYLNIEAYKFEQFAHEKINEKTFALGKEILQIYNTIPSKEIYDFDFLRGFMRQIQYYFSAYLFKEPKYALKLLDEMQQLLAHMKAQIILGKKFMYGTHAPASGNDYEVFLNETTITDSTYCFKSDEKSGLYFTHNMMNYLHTTDEIYVEESEQILNKLLENSSLISKVNEKERNSFFHQMDRTIMIYRQKIEADLSI